MTGRLRNAVCALAVVAAGCGGGTGTLSGEVTYQGKPVTSGMVTVVDADCVPHGATIQPDGHYLVTNIPAGPVRIAVASPDPRTAAAAAGEGGTAGPEMSNWRPIPERYADVATSGLALTLKRGENAFSIELTDGP